MNGFSKRRAGGGRSRLALSLAVIALAGLASACDDCTDHGMRWCDGNTVMLCEADHSMFGGYNYSADVEEECGGGDRCKEWRTLTGEQLAGCIPETICTLGKSVCRANSKVSCAEGGEKPIFDFCGDENYEGAYCRETYNGAKCVYSDEGCATYNSLKCVGQTRYYTRCSSGQWSELESCLVGESCVQIDDMEVECQIWVRY